MRQSHVVLVGMPGSGKSSIAARVARATGRRAVDADAEIERLAGRSIPEIFAAEGEDGFRAVESDVLATLLAGDQPLVIATGGGAVLREENRSLMRANGVVVWLRARISTLVTRVGDGRTRPLLADDPAAALRRLDAERAGAYAAAAHVVVDVDRLSPPAVCERVLAAVESTAAESAAKGTVSS